METNTITLNNHDIVSITSDSIILSDEDDILDIIWSVMTSGMTTIAINQSNISPTFFDLKTKLAWSILQKISTYGYKLIIIWDFSIYESKSLQDFIYESNKVGRVLFVDHINDAADLLS